MSHYLRPAHLFILLLLISFASVTGLLFVPALPQIDDYFGVSDRQAQWTISFFLTGYCLGQLPYGPLANRFGRKRTIYFGVSLAIFGSLLAYLSPNFLILCIARILQALGAAVGLKISFTMIGDQLTGKEAARAVSLLSLAFGIMPGLAVAAGGFIASFSGWRGCFLFLTFYSVFIGGLCLLLPETVKALDFDALRCKKIIKGYTAQFLNLKLVLNAFLVALATSMIYIFATLAPYLGIQKLGLTPSQFGIWNIIPASGLISGALFSRLLAKFSSSRTNILIGLGIILCGIAAMALSFAKGHFSAETMFISQFVIQAGNSLVWTNANVSASGYAQDKANGMAVVQFINVAGAVVGTFLIEFFPPTSLILMPSAFALILCLMIGIWRYLGKIDPLVLEKRN